MKSWNLNLKRSYGKCNNAKERKRIRLNREDQAGSEHENEDLEDEENNENNDRQRGGGEDHSSSDDDSDDDEQDVDATLSMENRKKRKIIRRKSHSLASHLGSTRKTWWR